MWALMHATIIVGYIGPIASSTVRAYQNYQKRIAMSLNLCFFIAIIAMIGEVLAMPGGKEPIDLSHPKTKWDVEDLIKFAMAEKLGWRFGCIYEVEKVTPVEAYKQVVAGFKYYIKFRYAVKPKPATCNIEVVDHVGTNARELLKFECDTSDWEIKFCKPDWRH